MYAELGKCPVCGRRLAVQSHVVKGTSVVCVDCRTTLKVVSITPLKFEKVDVSKTYNVDSRPESYG
ncbi:MAG: hypothetical protein RI985_1035 [Chloroflexota bacterium]|jgi:lysine biosynthesis protein LysW